MEEGRSFAGALVQIASYFTIQTNILVALVLTAVLIDKKIRPVKFFSQNTTASAVSMYIIIVGLIYAVILKGLWKPEGLFKLADNLLHTASPILFLIFWLTMVPKIRIDWISSLRWLIYPFFYLIYSLIRGALTGNYPYDFINAAKNGYIQIIINSIFVLIAFLIVGSLLIYLNNFLSKKQEIKKGAN